MSGQANQTQGQNQGIASSGNTPPKLQSSYSTDNVPMIKNGSSSSASTPNANNHAQQHFHNHNASMGRIPVGVVPIRHTRELSSDSNSGVTRDQPAPYQSMHSVLQGSAPAFGPSMTATASAAAPQPQAQAPATVSAPVNQPPQTIPPGYNTFYTVNGFIPPGATVGNPGGYNMNMITAGMQQMGINGANGPSVYPNSNQPYNAYAPAPGPVPGPGPAPYQPNNGQQQQQQQQQPQPQSQQPRDSQARVIQSRRRADDEG